MLRIFMLSKHRLKRTSQLCWLRFKGLVHSVAGSKQYHKFVIISRSRTGSNLLISLLNSHPHVVAYGEMFNHLHSASPQQIWSSIFTYYPTTTKQVGFKIFYYHPLDSDNKWIWDKIYMDDSLRIIHLTRSNTLRTYLSRQIAGMTMEWTNRSSSKRSKPPIRQVHLDPTLCLKEFEQTQAWASECRYRVRGHRVFELDYKQLTGRDQTLYLQRVQLFLQLTPISLRSSLKKQNTANLSDVISNYSEVADALMGTQWEHFLYDE
jgi:LPS sulfotransferase NodH